MTDQKKKDWEERVDDAQSAEETGENVYEAAEETSEAQAAFSTRRSGRPIAYIRPVTKQEVEGALPPDAPDGPYFALHDEEGRPLALFEDADSAWAAARVNNLQTLSVH